MADVSAELKDWSIIPSSNQPADATTIGAGMADNFQQIQATVRAALAHKGSDLNSAATIDLGANTGFYHDIVGATGPITSFGTVSAGVWKILQFDSTPTITHNATSMILPGGASITMTAGTHLMAMSLGGGNWIVPWCSNAPVRGIVSVKDYGAIGNGVADDTAAIQAALNSGRRIYAPEGTYLTGSITLPSNTWLYGAGTELTIFKAKNSIGAPVFINSDTSGGNSNITLLDFRINGNSAGNAAGSHDGIRLHKSDNNLIERVHIDDFIDWSFGMYEGNGFTLRDCLATGMIGINNPAGVRAGYLFGTTSTLRYANDVTVENCEASDVTDPYVDGFIFEQGDSVTVSNCRAIGIPYSGFKLNAMHNVEFLCNRAKECLLGFQQLSYCNNVQYIGNRAVENSSAGFHIGNGDTANISKGVMLHSNFAIDNGQNAYSALYGASGVRYGIAFEGTVAATVDRVSVKDNVCIDNGGGTQGRGISFGGDGTFSNVFMDGNVCRGNTADFVGAASLQLSTFTYGQHIGLDVGSQQLAGGQSRHPYRFYLTDAAAGSGGLQLNDGITDTTPRGFIMPRVGYLLGIYVKSNAAVTAGSITFFPRINNSNFGSGLSITSGTFNLTEETFQANQFAAGDILTCIYTSTAGLLPAGTNDFDVTILVVF
jgi:hypothetical protein